MATRTFEQPINRSAAIDLVYPVGSIYMSVSDVSPETMFSNTRWTQLENRFLVAAGSTYSPGSTGGGLSSVVTFAGTVGDCTLEEKHIPSHFHSLNNHYHTAGDYVTNSAGNHTHKAQGWQEAPRSGSSASGYPKVRTRLRASAGGSYSNENNLDGMTASGKHTHQTVPSNFMQGYTGTTASYGEGQAHTHRFIGAKRTINTLPPCLPVYMWRRDS